MSADSTLGLSERREHIRHMALSHAIDLADDQDGGYVVVANAAIFEAYLTGDDARAGLDRGDAPPSYDVCDRCGKDLDREFDTVTISGQMSRALAETIRRDALTFPSTELQAALDLLDPAGGLPPDVDAPAPETDDDVPAPATVGPETLKVEALDVGCSCTTCSDQRLRVVDLVASRLAQYPADATVAQVYADWFGGDAS